MAPLVFLLLFGQILVCTGLDTITSTTPLSGSQKIVSQGSKFTLGFYSPPQTQSKTISSTSGDYYYIGIWYSTVPLLTPVWTATTDVLVSDLTTASLEIAKDGNLVLRDQAKNRQLWSTNVNLSSNSTMAIIRDSGSLELTDASNPSMVYWRSIDHPTDTWLPGAKLAINRITGVSNRLVSWKNSADPSPGLFSVELDPNGITQFLIQWNKSVNYTILMLAFLTFLAPQESYPKVADEILYYVQYPDEMEQFDVCEYIVDGLRSGARRVHRSLERDEGCTVLEGCLLIPQILFCESREYTVGQLVTLAEPRIRAYGQYRIRRIIKRYAPREIYSCYRVGEAPGGSNAGQYDGASEVQATSVDGDGASEVQAASLDGDGSGASTSAGGVAPSVEMTAFDKMIHEAAWSVLELERVREDEETKLKIASLTCALEAIDLERANLLSQIECVRQTGLQKRMHDLTEKTVMAVRDTLRKVLSETGPFARPAPASGRAKP